MKPEQVCVIMRSKNSAWVIGQALASLQSQTFQGFELLIVDSGSTDRTLEIVDGFPHRLIQIPPQDYFPGAVLNEAIRATSADILVFQNSDVVHLSPRTLERLLAAFDQPEVAAAFARQVPRPEAHTWVRRDYEISFPAAGDAPPWMSYSLPLAAMRRTAWEEHPFYEDAWGSEDSEWGHWARRQGRVVRYVPEAVVMHSHNYTLRQLYGRRFIEGEADAFIHRDRVSVPKLVARAAASVLNDLGSHLRARDWRGLALSPVRRTVYHWAYHQGHRLGERRIDHGDADARVGQKVVLDRYG